MIFIITVEKLNDLNVDTYKSFLFDTFVEEISMDSNNIIALGSKFNNIPCGAIFAEIEGNTKNCNIKSFFVSNLFRQNGIGSRIIETFRKEAKNLGIKKVIFKAITSKENIILLDKFLSKRGFKKAELLTEVYNFNPETLLKDNRFIRLIVNTKFKLPPKVSIIPWTQVDEKLIDKVKRKEGIDYPDVLSPFANEFGLKEECTHFAIFDNKEIVGWMTGLKAHGNIILYRSLFVREDYRKSALGYFLFSECIKNHKKNHMDKNGLCAIALDNNNARKFISLYFKNMYDHKKYEFKIEMDI